MRYDDPILLSWLKNHIYTDVCDFITCEYCNSIIKRRKLDIINARVPSRKTKHFFCNSKCARYFICPPTTCICVTCKNSFIKKPSTISKTGRTYCSQSCAAIYNNSHKTTGTTRSKLESFLEQKIRTEFPLLKLLVNDVSTLNMELDLYLPSLNLAFEINGVFHYFPIFGEEKLSKTQNKDIIKQIKCREANISLCVINTTESKYFTEQSSIKYWEIVKEIITISQ